MPPKPVPSTSGVVFEPARFSEAGELARTDRQMCHEGRDECDGCAWCMGPRTDYHRWFSGADS